MSQAIFEKEVNFRRFLAQDGHCTVSDKIFSPISVKNFILASGISANIALLHLSLLPDSAQTLSNKNVFT